METPRCIARALVTALVVLAAGAAPAAAAPVLVGAGDITQCSAGAEATAKLLDGIPGTVFTAGDNAYPHGSLADYEKCYAPSWGRLLARTRPAPGNHEYETAGAAGYFAYFGARAGAPSRGYYSYDLGTWHVVVLNSSDDCAAISCSAASPQLTWLRADLAASTAPCTVAIWHHPRFSSGPHGSNTRLAPFWDALYAAGADVVVNGHDHVYQRFAPQTPAGVRDDARGIREFVVGTGGKSHDRLSSPLLPNTEAANGSTFGVLALTLRAASYAWRFVPVAGGTFTDAGSTACHDRAGGAVPGIAITSHPRRATLARRVAIGFAVRGPVTSVRCRLDRGPLRRCASPFRLSGLRNGSHVVRVTATNAAGSRTAVFGFVVGGAPWIHLLTRPPALSTRSVLYRWGVIGARGRAMCRLDARRPRRCINRAAYAGLAPGRHRFTLRIPGRRGKVGVIVVRWRVR